MEEPTLESAFFMAGKCRVGGFYALNLEFSKCGSRPSSIRRVTESHSVRMCGNDGPRSGARPSQTLLT